MADLALEGLPEHLAERVLGGTRSPRGDGRYVVYWMRSAARAHENPALDVALLAATRLGLPVFVYHALSERFPYASDRHHTFILQGAREVQAEMAKRGVGYAFHLERQGHRGAHLLALAREAALVVTGLMPVPFLRQWVARLAEQVAAPIWQVDSACVVPMPLVERPFARAYEFREATAGLREARLHLDWQDVDPPGPSFVPDSLPFKPVDLQTAELPKLVAACDIDHTVGPVYDTLGGATAGYARWDSFRDSGLAAYHKRRNDATVLGTSRLSAYLHHGHVSPLRIARQAAASASNGAEKFLDELLVWRELAYHWCRLQDDPEILAALPEWARQTLLEHAGDAREPISWERLARGRTNDPLWNAAQTSLLRHGELHNNVRMTWGKAIAFWTANPQSALDRLVDLNHRYALDGRDPASYGGLLWCLGLFDRPFEPPQPVLGSVRTRPSNAHARRIDLAAFRRRVERPLRDDPPRVAVIGAGLAGLMCARTLADHGLDVTVLEKARGSGGRMAARREDDAVFDYGAQYFTVTDPRLGRYARAWGTEGLVARWAGRTGALEPGRFVESPTRRLRVVGVPGMSAVTRHLAEDLRVRFETRIDEVAREGDGWRLIDGDGGERGPFERVVISAPGPQAGALLGASPELAARARGAQYAPCWTVMARFDPPLAAPFDSAHVSRSRLSWVARNASKPGRSEVDAWTMNATPQWSREHFDDEPEAVLTQLLEAFAEVMEIEREPVWAGAHRWRYALAETPLDEPCLYDDELGIGACGDWCLGARVEFAFLSGCAMAGRVLGRL